MTAATTSVFTPRLSASERWGVRLLSLLIWALLAGSVAYWVLRSPADLAGAPAAATVAAEPPALPSEAALARLFGHGDDIQSGADAASAQTAAGGWSSRVVVYGVAAGHGGTGAAILAVDDKPPQPYRTGQEVADGWQLVAVTARAIVLQAGTSGADADKHRPQRVVLRMPTDDSPEADAEAESAQGAHGFSSTADRVAGEVPVTPSSPSHRAWKGGSNTAVRNTVLGSDAVVSVLGMTDGQAGVADVPTYRRRSNRMSRSSQEPSQDKDAHIGIVSTHPPMQEAPAEPASAEYPAPPPGQPADDAVTH